MTVRGDPRLLRRMIRNLLENARRHGAPPVDVRVRAEGGAVELTRLRPRRRAFPTPSASDVFRPFRRFGGTEAGAGAGLGLALVRQIARRHGGEARYLGRVLSAELLRGEPPARSRQPRAAEAGWPRGGMRCAGTMSGRTGPIPLTISAVTTSS